MISHLRILRLITVGVCLLIATPLVWAQEPTSKAGDGPEVFVTGGEIRGRMLDESGGAVFKAIPFAEPPTGNLRWREPLPVRAWTGVRYAGAYPAPCAQIAAGWNDRAAAISREDCLYLNVWAPEWPPKSRRPVMFWIHGGANMGGSTLGSGGIESASNGEKLARHGMVVVSTNYRLGVFGFMAHPELTAESPYHASGNYGLLDQIAALRWVHDNIARLGGDPAKVTIFGQSAGAQDVGLLMASPLTKGLFQRAIQESGTVIIGGALTPRCPRPRKPARSSPQNLMPQQAARSRTCALFPPPRC